MGRLTREERFVTVREWKGDWEGAIPIYTLYCDDHQYRGGIRLIWCAFEKPENAQIVADRLNEMFDRIDLDFSTKTG